MEIDIYCQNDKCPICGKEIEWNTKFSDRKSVGFCPNNCYGIFKYGYNFPAQGCAFYIFNERYNYSPYKLIPILIDERLKTEEEVKKMIDYYKEDYRYLAEILELS